MQLKEQLQGAKVVLKATGLKGGELAAALDRVAASLVGYSILEAAEAKAFKAATDAQIAKLAAAGYCYSTSTGWEPSSKGWAAGARVVWRAMRWDKRCPKRVVLWPSKVLAAL